MKINCFYILLISVNVIVVIPQSNQHDVRAENVNNSTEYERSLRDDNLKDKEEHMTDINNIKKEIQENTTEIIDTNEKVDKDILNFKEDMYTNQRLIPIYYPSFPRQTEHAVPRRWPTPSRVIIPMVPKASEQIFTPAYDASFEKDVRKSEVVSEPQINKPINKNPSISPAETAYVLPSQVAYTSRLAEAIIPTPYFANPVISDGYNHQKTDGLAKPLIYPPPFVESRYLRTNEPQPRYPIYYPSRLQNTDSSNQNSQIGNNFDSLNNDTTNISGSANSKATYDFNNLNRGNHMYFAPNISETQPQLIYSLYKNSEPKDKAENTMITSDNSGSIHNDDNVTHDPDTNGPNYRDGSNINNNTKTDNFFEIPHELIKIKESLSDETKHDITYNNKHVNHDLIDNQDFASWSKNATIIQNENQKQKFDYVDSRTQHENVDKSVDNSNKELIFDNNGEQHESLIKPSDTESSHNDSGSKLPTEVIVVGVGDDNKKQPFGNVDNSHEKENPTIESNKHNFEKLIGSTRESQKFGDSSYVSDYSVGNIMFKNIMGPVNTTQKYNTKYINKIDTNHTENVSSTPKNVIHEIFSKNEKENVQSNTENDKKDHIEYEKYFSEMVFDNSKSQESDKKSDGRKFQIGDERHGEEKTVTISDIILNPQTIKSKKEPNNNNFDEKYLENYEHKTTELKNSYIKSSTQENVEKSEKDELQNEGTTYNVKENNNKNIFEDKNNVTKKEPENNENLDGRGDLNKDNKDLKKVTNESNVNDVKPSLDNSENLGNAKIKSTNSDISVDQYVIKNPAEQTRENEDAWYNGKDIATDIKQMNPKIIRKDEINKFKEQNEDDSNSENKSKATDNKHILEVIAESEATTSVEINSPPFISVTDYNKGNDDVLNYSDKNNDDFGEISSVLQTTTEESLKSKLGFQTTCIRHPVDISMNDGNSKNAAGPTRLEFYTKLIEEFYKNHNVKLVTVTQKDIPSFVYKNGTVVNEIREVVWNVENEKPVKIRTSEVIKQL